MTAVLLIADSERVQRIFADLESKGVLQLHAATTLDQADQELRETLPAFTFVQSRISGLSAGILLRHLKKRLPDDAKIVLMYGAAADLQPASSTTLPPVDLRVTDDALAATIAGIVTGTATPSPAKARKAATSESEAKRRPRREKGARLQGSKGKQADPPEQPRPVQSPGLAVLPPDQGIRQPEDDFSDLPLPLERLPVLDEATVTGEAVTAAPTEEPAPAGEPAVTEVPGSSFGEMVQSASARRGVDLPAPFPTEEPDEKAAAGPALKKKPLWPFLLLIAFLLIPSAGYLLGRISAAPEQEARQQGAAVSAQRGISAAAASATPRTPSRTAAPVSHEGAPPQEGMLASGVASLPPFLAGVELDPRYGDRHPGWERYLGSRAEYRLFREGGRYRAIQAIARGDEIPDQLFRRVLLEFGAIAGYAVKSSEQKGEYLVEQAACSGSAALTIYRNMNDRRIKGLVVYYR